MRRPHFYSCRTDLREDPVNTDTDNPTPRHALPDPTPAPDAPPSPVARPGLLLVLMCLALALVVGATSSLAVAQPTIAAALGATQTELTWVVNAYVLAFAALLLPAGIATDKYGRRLAVTAGLAVFGLACLASAFADSPTTLIALRAVAGVGATFVMPATLSVLVDAYPAHRRDFAVAVWAGITGAGALLGVLMAGLLLHWHGWGSIQFTYGVAALVLAVPVALMVPHHRNPSLHLDMWGGALAAVGVGAVVYGVIEAPERGWTDGLTLTGLIVGGAALLAFVVVELRVARPMLDIRLFRSRGLAAGSLLVLLLSLAVFGFFLLGPQFLQSVKGYDSLDAALRLLPFAIGIGPASQLSPHLTSRFGPKWTGAVGSGTMGSGLALFALTANDGYLPFAVALIVTAFGMGIALTAGTSLIIEGLPADRRTLSSAVNDVTRELGGALGGAILGSILLSLYRDGVDGVVAGLPGDAADAARQGIGGALLVADQLPRAGSAELIATAQHSFTSGYQGAMWTGAAVLILTAFITGFLAPSKAGRR